MAVLATATETAGCICLALGLFTRLISLPLMVTMTVAGLSVHWSHGWAAIAGKTAESTLRFQAFMEWLAQNFPGRFNYITQLGDPIILNNEDRVHRHLCDPAGRVVLPWWWPLGQPRLLAGALSPPAGRMVDAGANRG
jgi:disulfide bond formation protein DsbB